MAIFNPKGKYPIGEAVVESFEQFNTGKGRGPVTVWMPKKGKYPLVDSMLGVVDNVVGYVTGAKRNVEAGDKPKATPPPAPTTPANGFSRKDYRDADLLDGEFAYASIKRDAIERGYNVVEMPDLRMNSFFGNIGYEKDNDIFIAMSKAYTREGVEVIAHELMAKDLQRETGRYDHNYFHPVIEWLQGSVAMQYLTGRNNSGTIDAYNQRAMEALAA